ncbi:glycosyltransferase, partial [Neisseria gonorrhoeae]|uniref:glycosyltransferase n=1 Tax=Neisseria gonorrhoeae TaxID=485 RepID=UPI0038516F2C
IRENGLPDLIHAHCMNYAGILAQKISEKYGIPYVLTEHSSTIRTVYRPVANEWRDNLELQLYIDYWEAA